MSDGDVPETMTSTATDLRHEVALACRALAVAGVLEGVLGHISVRTDDGALLLRCRGPQERGLRFTQAEDIRLVDLEGRANDLADHVLPHEFPIHRAILAARTDVRAVVHAHPPYALLVGLAGIELEPAFGAYNIPAMRLADEGVPRYPRAVLIDDDDLAADMLTVMADARTCLLQGHGIVTVGATLAEAVVAAANLETLSRVAVQLASLGAPAAAIPSTDRARLPDLGRGFNDGHAYRHLMACAEEADRAAAAHASDAVPGSLHSRSVVS